MLSTLGLRSCSAPILFCPTFMENLCQSSQETVFVTEKCTNWAEEKSGDLVASNKNINIISLYSSSSLEYRKHKIILFLKCCKGESHTVHAASVSFTENCV